MPAHYYSLSKPLVPGRSLDIAAWGVLLTITIVLLAVSARLFVGRDIGSVARLLTRSTRVLRSDREAAGSDALLGSVLGKGVRDLLVPTLAWGGALGIYAILIVATANEVLTPLRDALKNFPMVMQLLGDMTSVETYLAGSLFADVPLLLTFFAITQVASWTGDEEEGRMEVLVAEPISRSSILLARYAAIGMCVIAILLIMGVCILATAAVTNTTVKADHLAAGLLVTGLLTMVVLAFGLALAAWLERPGLALPITAGLAIAAFFLNALAPLFNWPEIISNLSIYHLFGKPMQNGLGWGNTVVLGVAALLLGAASVIVFDRRDIAK